MHYIYYGDYFSELMKGEMGPLILYSLERVYGSSDAPVMATISEILVAIGDAYVWMSTGLDWRRKHFGRECHQGETVSYMSETYCSIASALRMDCTVDIVTGDDYFAHVG